MGFCHCSILSDMSSAGSIILASLLGIPMTWLCNYFDDILDPVAIFSIGVVCLLTVISVVYFNMGEQERAEPLYYVIAICCFASVVDLLIALENDGYISGFLQFYLKNGEPYLSTAFGTMICYWDGTFHFALYICLLIKMSTGQPVHNLGLIWCGSIINSMIVLMLGNILGNHDVKPSILLNIPFIFVPLYALVRFLNESERNRPIVKSRTTASRITAQVDILSFLLCAVALLIFLLTGMGALNWKENNLLHEFVDKIIPYLNDPVFYPKIQHVTYLFYLVPYYGVAMYGLFKCNYSWMNDWAYFFLGAILQGQFTFIGASFHRATQPRYQSPQEAEQLSIFWTVNLVPVLVHLLLAYRSVLSEQVTRSCDNNGKKIHYK